ncbi:MAG: type II toxin-antitoxin system RelE/ParE family toxin [Prosthecobacter sp.]|uniref:type II toxin-antitoxin system RelE/ParE family toxin n=1 Tax=Prosthecobacter sp. TaxID=1965333 RepID=UPI0038FEB0AF
MFDPAKHMHPDVEDVDLVEIAEYIALDDPEAARRVIAAVREMLLTLARNPGVGTEYSPLRRTLKGIRMIPVTEYRNYLIYYRPLPDNSGVRILYVLHAARDATTFAREHRRQ